MNDLLKQLQALIPLAENATAEPWHQHGQEEVRSWADQSIISAPAGEHQLGTSPEDAAFIVAARNVLTPENLTQLIGLLEGISALQQGYQDIKAQRDAAMLYGEACEKRRMELLELATLRLPSYDEMLTAAPLKGAQLHV